MTHAHRYCRVAATLALTLMTAHAVRAADPETAFPAGRWRSRVDGLILEIKGDGSFTIAPPDEKRVPLSGRWRESRGVVTFRNAVDAAACPDVPGRYRWSRDTAGSLRFELVEDSCRPRMMHMQRPFDSAPDG